MSVFEDLIDELKNENLLEDTVIDLKRADAAARNSQAAEIPASAAAAAPGSSFLAAADKLLKVDIPVIESPSDEREFFRKRAMDEVSSLQMIEHVFSGVEREHMKVASVAYDDLDAKKALHKFMQVSGDLRSPEHAAAEFELRNETEQWNFALYARDQKISVSNIRRFCEESRPVLSSQALIALARFYRNSPYSEDVRSKFDYVMTRLFAREAGEHTRVMLFEHNEMIGHINTLYANWSSIALYTQQDDQVEVSLTVTRFDEFSVEIDSVDSFDELLESKFFNRVRNYKEESAEMFYVPEVLAAAIKCNLTIGNRYVELICKQRSSKSAATIEEKYGVEYDQIVSDAAGKTLLLSEVLSIEFDSSFEGDEPSAKSLSPALAPSTPRPVDTESKAASSFGLFGVNKWLIVVCFVCILVSGGVYVWAEKFAGGEENTALSAKPVEFDDPEIKKYLRSSRYTNETLYAVTEPAFETLTTDEKKAVLGKAQKFAISKGLQKVNLLNKKGGSVASATKDRLEIMTR